MLVIGTESAKMLFLDSSGMSIKMEVNIPSVPVFFTIEGQFETDHRIWIACRDGNIYHFTKGKLAEEAVISLDSKPVGMVKMEKTILVAAMDCSIHSFYLKGKKNFTINLKEEILAI